MKKQTTTKLSLKKLDIAVLDQDLARNIKGGDCLLTEPTWYGHVTTANNCEDVITP